MCRMSSGIEDVRMLRTDAPAGVPRVLYSWHKTYRDGMCEMFMSLGFDRVWGERFGVEGIPRLGFGVQGLGSGVRIQGLGV